MRRHTILTLFLFTACGPTAIETTSDLEGSGTNGPPETGSSSGSTGGSSGGSTGGSGAGADSGGSSSGAGSSSGGACEGLCEVANPPLNCLCDGIPADLSCCEAGSTGGFECLFIPGAGCLCDGASSGWYACFDTECAMVDAMCFCEDIPSEVADCGCVAPAPGICFCDGTEVPPAVCEAAGADGSTGGGLCAVSAGLLPYCLCDGVVSPSEYCGCSLVGEECVCDHGVAPLPTCDT